MLLAPCKPKKLKELQKALFIDTSPVHQNRQRDILHDIQHRNQIIKLVNQSDLAPAENRKLLFLLRVDVNPVDIHSSARRHIHSAQNMQKCRFSGPRRTRDRDKFALFHGKGYVVKRPDRASPFPVYFADMFCFNHPVPPVCCMISL